VPREKEISVVGKLEREVAVHRQRLLTPREPVHETGRNYYKKRVKPTQDEVEAIEHCRTPENQGECKIKIAKEGHCGREGKLELERDSES
jgi:hypothetical protein